MRRHKTISILAGFAMLASTLGLTACVGGSEGMLSDDEKIQRATRGREDFQNAMRGGQPAAPNQAAPNQAPAAPPR